MPDPVHLLCHFIFLASLQGGHHYSHFTGEETEGQRGPQCQRPQSKEVAEQGSTPTLPRSKSSSCRILASEAQGLREGHTGPLGTGTLIGATLKMRKQRYRETKWFPPRNTPTWDLTPRPSFHSFNHQSLLVPPLGPPLGRGLSTPLFQLTDFPCFH